MHDQHHEADAGDGAADGLRSKAHRHPVGRKPEPDAD
jgi:hypothetical protein